MNTNNETLAILGGEPTSKEIFPEELPYIGEEEVSAVTEVIHSRKISVFSSPKVREFEEAFASLTGVPYAVTVNSGTAAIHASLLALGIQKGEEVIVPVYTYVASVIPMIFEGIRVIFADCDPDTMNIDPGTLETLITEKTRAILPVDLFGSPADKKQIQALCDEYDIYMIEDSAQAVGATFDGQHVGSFGVGCFSFGETKMITCGEGGMVTCQDRTTYERLLTIRQEGETIGNCATTGSGLEDITASDVIHHIDYPMIGYNFRMTALQAAMGCAQIDKLPSIITMRTENARYLMEGLNSVSELTFQCPHPRAVPVYNRLVARITPHIDRDAFLGALMAEGIPVGVWYPRLLTEGQLVKTTYPDQTERSFPGADLLCNTEIVLPVYPGLTTDHLDLVIEAVEKVVSVYNENPEITEKIHKIIKKRKITRFFSSVYMEH